ncbi:DUF4012 domain-containing protein [Pseudoclavibacter sp. CFCC 13796]|uniref:DUF4012 domain-containing protein n=1 Tax=Pseudoclavibacter sp. CFCC 13796 TaxID=2615179 RepID=UPI0013012128|nr:DUF4012 domain-containing protein [Pseudoclavibacter sp. CFCC 13796]KAB1661116.1 DUF4012 domain-containing protein [Pseudoclavibacter sp. CFCC 13796]
MSADELGRTTGRTPSRRELRDARSEPSRTGGAGGAIPDDDAGSGSAGSHHRRHRYHRRRRRPVWPWVVAVIVVVLAALGVVGVLLGKQAIDTRDHLQSAKDTLATVAEKYKAGDRAGAQASYETAQQDAAAASTSASGGLWSTVQTLPWIGGNLQAVRTVADETSGLLDDAQPLAEHIISLNPDQLVHDGAFDINTLSSIVVELPQLNERLTTARKTLNAIETGGLMEPVADGVTQLRDQVDGLQPGVQQASDLAQHVPSLLGADRPKNYLMLFQNNAEVRSLGGNPASLMLLRVDNGHLSIASQKSSGSFHNNRADPIAELPEGAYDVFIPNVSRFEMDMTGFPDLPSVAKLAQGWWKDAGGRDQIDGVMTFDPVGLSYMLRATGPVTLSNGDRLTSDNVVQKVLSDVYAKYPDPRAQDAYFAEAAASVFDALTGQKVDANALAGALGQSVNERRLSFWSADDSIQQALSENPSLQGVMGADGTGPDGSTVMGVYLWDTSNGGSKIDYHVTNSNVAKRTVCSAKNSTTYSVDVTLTSTISPKDAMKLPSYVLSQSNKDAQYFNTDIYVFGPQNSTFKGMQVVDGGISQSVKQQGSTLGRPGVRVATEMGFGTATTVRLTFEADGVQDRAPLDLVHTPMAHQTESSTEVSERCD